ncbi:unnamed protein product, partial [Rotaria sp. Silwood1]
HKLNRLITADFIFKELTCTLLNDQTNLNHDISIISSNIYQSQTSGHSDLQTTLVFSLESQRTFYCPSLIDQQLVKYEKAKYD